jgi:hypothetical protein
VDETLHIRKIGKADELSSLVKIMVMLEDASADLTAWMSPQHADICTRGQ